MIDVIDYVSDWEIYEHEKRKIIAQNLSATEYTQAIRQLCDKLKV